jgi:hypothetical protein
MTFGVFRNEHGKAEFAIQVVRDAKNMTLTPEKRFASTTSRAFPSPQLFWQLIWW